MDVVSLRSQILLKMSLVFGFDSFRSVAQEDAITRCIRDRADVFVGLPTAGGKSLCYQLPAIWLTGVTVCPTSVTKVLRFRYSHP